MTLPPLPTVPRLASAAGCYRAEVPVGSSSLPRVADEARRRVVREIRADEAWQLAGPVVCAPDASGEHVVVLALVVRP